MGDVWRWRGEKKKEKEKNKRKWKREGRWNEKRWDRLKNDKRYGWMD